jgi:SOUL heme-binding protein
VTKVLYFLVTFLESILAVFGIRSAFEQPSYQVVSKLADHVEIRSYGPLVVVETKIGGEDGAAFSRLFRYITGANAAGETIKMTAPVAQTGGSRFGGGSSSAGDAQTMQFVLPARLAAKPPAPTDPQVSIATVPARTLAVITFAGSFGRRNLDLHLQELRDVLARAGRKADGAPIFLGYDPPFTIPFLRRNEVALQIEP